ncbi:MAG TPA: alpha/beta hydrolase [Planctomycetaceae bacterium]|nr:alpha/beta hydrolase [Planctomycetaceae bacterium]
MGRTEPANAENSSKSWKRRILRTACIYMLLPYFAVTLIFTLAQRRLMYRPSVNGSLSVNVLRLDQSEVSDVRLRTPDSETLNGWLFKGKPSESAPRKLLIYFPGNSLNRHERITDLREVAALGFAVLIFDYRGFGDSTGSPSEVSLSADARLIWEYAHEELRYDDEDIVLFGESLGGAVVLSLWSEPPSSQENTFPVPRAVIFSSTFASMSRTVQLQYPWFPFHYLVLDRWPSIGRIRNVAVPTMILHGSEDDMVPLSEARALAAANAHAQFTEIPGAGHNDIPIPQLRTLLKKLLNGG